MAERIIVQKKIENAVLQMKPGTAFSAADFAGMNDTDAVNKALSRLAEQGIIRRAMQGVYDVPMKITLLDEDCDPLIPEIMRAAARKNGWSIAASGDAALYEIGIGPRPVSEWTYVSDGPPKVYEIGTQRLVIRTGKPREISGKHPKTALVIQAIRAIGKNITPEQIDAISERLSSEEKKILLEESRTVSVWIRKIVIQMTEFRIQKFRYEE
ncbi:MAG: DUF6088 family protein [Solobacterium sp.]|nr:DUF6088 family protein [Solobacterium sp.]